MHDALALDGVRALRVEVVGEEELLGPVELPPAALGLLRPVVPPDPHPHAPSPVGLQALDPSHVRLLVRVRRTHQHTVPDLASRKKQVIKQRANLGADGDAAASRRRVGTLDDLGGAPDGVGVDVPLALLGLGHGGRGWIGRKP